MQRPPSVRHPSSPQQSLPHSGWQFSSQSSSGSLLPSSHPSPAPTLRLPSPHETTVQSASHVADSTPPPSQSSPAATFVTLSPHVATEQFTSHVADSPPSSHSSPPSLFTMPSPQAAI